MALRGHFFMCTKGVSLCAVFLCSNQQLSNSPCDHARSQAGPAETNDHPVTALTRQLRSPGQERIGKMVGDEVPLLSQLNGMKSGC